MVINSLKNYSVINDGLQSLDTIESSFDDLNSLLKDLPKTSFNNMSREQKYMNTIEKQKDFDEKDALTLFQEQIKQEELKKKENNNNLSNEMLSKQLDNFFASLDGGIKKDSKQTIHIKEKIDNSTILEELSSIIDKKYLLLTKEIERLSSLRELNNSLFQFKKDLKQIIDNKGKSIKSLIITDTKLNELISVIDEMHQNNNEYKTKEKEKLMNELNEYQKYLEDKYGKYWFSKINDFEREQYILLSMQAHNLSRKIVEQSLAQSINISYNQIIKENSKTIDYDSEIKNKINYATSTLKQMYHRLNEATTTQIEEFKYLYDTISNINIENTLTIVEKQEKLEYINELTTRVNYLKESLLKSKSR
ncbi:MAG: hypothetical protein IJ572_05930 [Bacilli bacterium]|nr:hypothetical protein [Bacilli bacterium]